MTDILAPNQKHDHLGNIGGMIANPLQGFCDKNQFDRT
jgi:hypothetical protein